MYVRLRLVIIILFCLGTYLIFPQELKDIRISPQGDTIIIMPVPLSEIPGQVENTNANIKKIEDRLVIKGELLKFDSVYRVIENQVNQRKAKFETIDEYYTSRNLANDIDEWERIKAELGKWQDLISERITVIQKDLFELQTIVAIWEKTISGYKDEGVPENVLTSEKDLLKKIKATEKKEINAKTESIRKQNKLTELSVTIDGVLSDLEKKQKEFQSDYFRQDSPALWQAADSTTRLKSVRKQLANTKDETIRNLNNFYEVNRQLINLQILIFLALWVGLYFLHKTSKKMEEYREISEFNDAASILSHYGLSAFILALFSSVWIYTSLPSSIADILQFIYLVLAIYVIPKYIDKRFKKILYSLLILFFIHQLQDIFYGRVLFSRIILIIETFFAGWIIYKLIDPRDKISTNRFKQKWGIFFKILPVFFLFLLGALIGNIFGYINLAILLENAVIKSLFNLIILILAIVILEWILVILLRTPTAQSSNIIKNYTNNIENRLIQIIKIYGILLWIWALLSLLGVYQPLSDWLNEFINESYKVGSTTIEIGGILTFFLVLFATVIVYRAVKIMLADEIFPRVKLPRGVPGSISMITGYFIAGYGIAIAIGAAGVDLSNFGLVAGALGVGIGFGLQGIVANFIAGIVLAFERPIQVGDTIQLAEMYGDVMRIGVRSTTIKTYDGSEVIVPNSDLISKDVINWTLSDRKKRRDIYVGVAYGSDPQQVMKIISKVANDHPEVQKIPAPWALFDGFGDSALNFRIRIWTTMDTGMTTKSDVTVAIYDALQKAGISIPFPQRDLYIKSLPEDKITKTTISKKRLSPKRKKTTDKPKDEEIDPDNIE